MFTCARAERYAKTPKALPPRDRLGDHQPQGCLGARWRHERRNCSAGFCAVAKQTALARLAGIGVCFCLTGCFDVTRVDVSGAAALEIDDFEDGDQVPSSALFDGWDCFEFEDAAPRPACLTKAPGFQSQRAESLTFELGAPLNGDDSSVGAGIGVLAPILAAVDFGDWQRLRFDAKFEPSALAAADATPVWIRVKCKDVASGSVPGGFMIQEQVILGRDWSSVSRGWRRDPAAPLAQPGFEQPVFQTIAIDAADCLATVSGLTFEIQRTDGQPGTLTLDNVALE
jgi:hypothetical protein